MLHISMNVCKTWKLEISKKHFEIKLHLIFNESVVMEKKEIDLYQTAPYAALTPLCTCLTCFTPYNIERAHCFRRGAHSLGANPERKIVTLNVLGRKEIRIFYKVFNVTIFP